MDDKQILILNHNDFEKGTFFRCFYLAKYLNKYFSKLTLVCLNDINKHKFTEDIELDGINIKKILGQHGKSSFFELPFHIIRAFINAGIVLTGKYNFVYITAVASPTNAFSTLFIKFLKSIGVLKVKIIVDWDDLWGRGGLVTFNKQGREVESVATFFETKIPLLADKVTVASRFLFDLAERSGVESSKIFFFPNGACTDYEYNPDKNFYREKLDLPIDEHILCFVGRGLWTFDYLMDCFDYIFKKKSNIIIIYISPLDKVCLDKIARLKLEDKLLCLGTMRHKQIFPYLISSDILLLPRVDNVVEKANYPARLGDYLSAGRPVVSNDIGDEAGKFISENNCGLLAKPNDISEFSDNIMTLLNNPEMMDKIGKNNRALAESKASWEFIAKKVFENVF